MKFTNRQINRQKDMIILSRTDYEKYQNRDLNGYIVPEYEVLHTQSREYIVDDLLDVMKERGVEV